MHRVLYLKINILFNRNSGWCSIYSIRWRLNKSFKLFIILNSLTLEEQCKLTVILLFKEGKIRMYLQMHILGLSQNIHQNYYSAKYICDTLVSSWKKIYFAIRTYIESFVLLTETAKPWTFFGLFSACWLGHCLSTISLDSL